MIDMLQALSGLFAGAVAVLIGLNFLRGQARRQREVLSLVAPLAATASLAISLGALVTQYRAHAVDLGLVLQEIEAWVSTNDFILGMSASLIANTAFAIIVYRRAKPEEKEIATS